MADPMLRQDNSPELGPKAPTFEQAGPSSPYQSFMENSAVAFQGLREDISNVLHPSANIESLPTPNKKATILATAAIAISGAAAIKGIPEAFGADQAAVAVTGEKPTRVFREYSINSDVAISKEKKLIKKCSNGNYQLYKSVSSGKIAREKYGSMHIDITPDNRTKAVWKNKTSLKLCGMEVNTMDSTKYFPGSVTTRTKKGGTFVDPYTIESGKNIQSIVVFLKKKK